MSRFFNIVRKSQEQMGDSSEFLDGTAENIEKACDPPQIPVEEAHIRAGSIRRMAATMKLAIKK